LLGYFMFLGGCIGYMMARSMPHSPGDFESAARFWRALALAFGALVGVPLLLLFVLHVPAGPHVALYHGLTWWLGLIYLLVPATLALWLWRWWHGSPLTVTDRRDDGQRTRKRFQVWFTLGMLVPGVLFVQAYYFMAFKSSWTGGRLSESEFQKTVTGKKNAEFSIEQFENGSKNLFIRLPEGRRGASYWLPVTDSILNSLAQNHIAFKVRVAGKDFAQLGAPLSLLGMLSMFIAPAGLVLLARKPWREPFAPPLIEAQAAGQTDRRARNVFRAFAVSLGIGLLSLAVFLGLLTRWHTRTVVPADLPEIVSAYKSSQFEVCVLNDGSRELYIRPRGRGVGPFVAPADEATLSLLQQRGIAYDTFYQGRDFGYRGPSQLFSGVCIGGLAILAIFLFWSAAKEARPPA
jgi:hypothetical protein